MREGGGVNEGVSGWEDGCLVYSLHLPICMYTSFLS